MEFAGVGAIPFEPPREELEPFMRRKMRTWISTWRGNIDGVIYRSDHLKEVAEYVLEVHSPLHSPSRVTAHILYGATLLNAYCTIGFQWHNRHSEEWFPEEERPKVTEERIALWDFVLMCDQPGDSIPAEDIVEEYVNRIFAEPQERKKYMERFKDCASIFFRHIDLNKDGVVDFEEYVKGCQVVSREALRTLFDVIDANEDGYIQLDEFLYAVLFFVFSSGPDSPLSLMFGPVQEEEK